MNADPLFRVMAIFVGIILLMIALGSCAEDDDDSGGEDSVDDDTDVDDDSADDASDAAADDSGDDDSVFPDDTADDAADDSALDDTQIDGDDSFNDDPETWTPGLGGFLAVSGDRVYPFYDGRLSASPILDYEDETEGIATYQGAAYFASHTFPVIKIYRYFEQSLDLVYEFRQGDAGSDNHVVSMAPYSFDSLLLLEFFQPDFPPDYYGYVPFIDIEPYGLAQGFRGGAYPYDQTKIYSYDGSVLTTLATVPSGILQTVAPYGDGFIAATEEEILMWDPSAQWTPFADGTAVTLLTDPEGDLLVERHNSGNDAYEYYFDAGGTLQRYEFFDTSSCRYGFLYGGGAKGFFCADHPLYVPCDEGWGNQTYLITENSGNIDCQGLPYQSAGEYFAILW